MPQIGWWLLPFVVLFSLGAFKRGQLALRRTALDGWLLLFLLTAVLAVWPAYNQTQAVIKLANIGGGYILYYLLAGRKGPGRWRAAGLLALMGFFVAAAFLLAHDWQAWPADLALLTGIGLKWMAVRPALSIPPIHPNQAGGIAALLLPFGAAWGWYGWRRKRYVVVGTAVLLTGVMGMGLLLSSSRAAWLALAAALVIGLLWPLSQKTAGRTPWPPPYTFLLLVALFLLAGWGLSFLIADGPLALLGHLPGSDSRDSRLALYRQTLYLIADFPFTGGGLAAFAGLYSQYIAVTPFFLFDYGHNLWLDVAVEQGIVAGLVLIGVYASCVVWLWRASLRPSRSDDCFLVWAAAAALVTFLLHSLVDDAVYGGLGTPLLFVLPGMAAMLTDAGEKRPLFTFSIRRRRMIAVVVLLALLAAGIGRRYWLAARWQANWGAVSMARIELAAWPTGRWDDGRYLAALAPAQQRLRQAVALDGANVTAHYRLGLMAMQARDFATAVTHLQTAYEQQPQHRGIAKSLGYSYVWTNNFEEGMAVLAPITEAGREMAVYAWWWREQGEEALAEQAAAMAATLDGE